MRERERRKRSTHTQRVESVYSQNTKYKDTIHYKKNKQNCHHYMINNYDYTHPGHTKMRSCIKASQSKQKISRQFGHCNRTPSMRAPHPRHGVSTSHAPAVSPIPSIRDAACERDCAFDNGVPDCRGAVFDAPVASASVVSTEDGISRKTLTGNRWW